LGFKASLGKIVHKTLSGKKKPSQKRVGGLTQGIGPEFKPQYPKQQQKKNEILSFEGKWIELEIIVSGEISQTHKANLHLENLEEGRRTQN
jgi:hypothetical protein